MVKSTLNRLFSSSTSAKLEGTANSIVTRNRPPSNKPSRPSGTATLEYKLFEGKAIVEAMIQPSKSGRVRFQGSWWSARCEQDVTILPGEAVRVVGRQNITLLVEPLPLLVPDQTPELN